METRRRGSGIGIGSYRRRSNPMHYRLWYLLDPMFCGALTLFASTMSVVTLAALFVGASALASASWARRLDAQPFTCQNKNTDEF